MPGALTASIGDSAVSHESEPMPAPIRRMEANASQTYNVNEQMPDYIKCKFSI